MTFEVIVATNLDWNGRKSETIRVGKDHKCGMTFAYRIRRQHQHHHHHIVNVVFGVVSVNGIGDIFLQLWWAGISPVTSRVTQEHLHRWGQTVGTSATVKLSKNRKLWFYLWTRRRQRRRHRIDMVRCVRLVLVKRLWWHIKIEPLKWWCINRNVFDVCAAAAAVLSLEQWLSGVRRWNDTVKCRYWLKTSRKLVNS